MFCYCIHTGVVRPWAIRSRTANANPLLTDAVSFPLQNIAGVGASSESDMYADSSRCSGSWANSSTLATANSSLALKSL